MSGLLGAYAGPVLSAYGLSLALIGAVVWLSWRRGVRVRRRLRDLEAGRSAGAGGHG